MPLTGRRLRSLLGEDASLRLSIEEIELSDPTGDELVVRIEASPINPSDLGILLGPATVASLRTDGADLLFDVPPARLIGQEARIGRPIPVGNESAGTVVAAGDRARALIGRRVGALGGGMYADYRKLRLSDVIPLPDGIAAADGAAMFINPLTALGFAETARAEGHKAIVHTAAASNLGQMLQKVCLEDGVPLVNIVRSDEQAAILRGIGATHVLDSRAPDFLDRLVDAITETRATIAFDAIGGGTLGSDILRAMERVERRDMTVYSPYGTSVLKQLYVYGLLDPAPVQIDRISMGLTWNAGGWLLTNFLAKAGAETNARLRQRIVDELTTTFASHYTRTIGLAEALDPDVLRAYERKATGEKYLIDPTRG